MQQKQPIQPVRSDNSPAPLYMRVKRMIRDQVLSGVWPPGHRVPSESELVLEFGVSRMTVNRALRELAADGLIVRVQGVGSFVAESKPHAALFDISSIADEIAARGHKHSARVITLEEDVADQDVARALVVDEGTRIFRSIIIHSDDDVPVLLEHRYIASDLVPDYLQQDFLQITAHAYLMSIAPPTEIEHVVESVTAEPWERRLLKISATEPCLLLQRRTWWGRRVVSWARLLYPGTRYRLEGRFVQSADMAHSRWPGRT
ncbi:MAG: histidine utilization repressor [Aquisalimonadaceae bacterium]